MTKKDTTNRIFVYGTMMTGMERSYLVPPCIQVVSAMTFGKLYYCDNPFMIPTPERGDNKVFGEILFMEPEVWKEYREKLDRAHGTTDKIYVRGKIEAIITGEIFDDELEEEFEQGEDVECWCYGRTMQHFELLKKKYGRDNIPRIRNLSYPMWRSNPLGAHWAENKGEK